MKQWPWKIIHWGQSQIKILKFVKTQKWITGNLCRSPVGLHLPASCSWLYGVHKTQQQIKKHNGKSLTDHLRPRPSLDIQIHVWDVLGTPVKCNWNFPVCIRPVSKIKHFVVVVVSERTFRFSLCDCFVWILAVINTWWSSWRMEAFSLSWTSWATLRAERRTRRTPSGFCSPSPTPVASTKRLSVKAMVNFHYSFQYTLDSLFGSNVLCSAVKEPSAFLFFLQVSKW